MGEVSGAARDVRGRGSTGGTPSRRRGGRGGGRPSCRLIRCVCNWMVLDSSADVCFCRLLFFFRGQSLPMDSMLPSSQLRELRRQGSSRPPGNTAAGNPDAEANENSSTVMASVITNVKNLLRTPFRGHPPSPTPQAQQIESVSLVLSSLLKLSCTATPLGATHTQSVASWRGSHSFGTRSRKGPSGRSPAWAPSWSQRRRWASSRWC
jgi:hypothetical protein